MLIDGIKLLEGSILQNPALDRGPDFPPSPNTGELFYNTTINALCVYSDTMWVQLGAVSKVAGRTGEVVLTVEDIDGALAIALVGAPGGVPALNEQGLVPDDQLNTYNKTEIDTKITNAAQAQYHGTPYDIATAVVNKPTGSAKVLRFVAPRQFKILENAVGSVFRAGSVSAAPAIFGVFKNDAQIGTITFATGTALATCVLAETTFGIGDVLGIVAPPVQDTKLADLMITVAAQL